MLSEAPVNFETCFVPDVLVAGFAVKVGVGMCDKEDRQKEECLIMVLHLQMGACLCCLYSSSFACLSVCIVVCVLKIQRPWTCVVFLNSYSVNAMELTQILIV